MQCNTSMTLEADFNCESMAVEGPSAMVVRKVTSTLAAGCWLLLSKAVIAYCAFHHRPAEVVYDLSK